MIRSLLLLPLLANLSALEILGVDYSQSDKQGHFILGAATSAVSMLALNMVKPDAKWYTRAAVGIASSAIVGAAKEWSDSHDLLHHTVDQDDFVATVTGGTVAALTLCWRF